MSTRLFLIRHAESTWGANRVVHGQSDPPLSDLGRRQAVALAEAIRGRRVDAVYSSPLTRAHETAAAIATVNQLDPIVEEAFREAHLGAWQGRPLDDLEGDEAFAACQADPATVSAPGGETMAQVARRVSGGVGLLIERHPGGSVVLVTHSIVGRVLISCLLAGTTDLVARLKLKTASISILRLDPRGPVLERLGDVGHLQGAGADAAD